MPKKAALHNLGCKVNSYELEAAEQLLEKSGYQIVPFAPGADLYIINTCTVTNIADRKSRQMLHKAKKMNPDALVVAMGCYAQIQGEKLEKDPAIDVIIGNNRRNDLVRVIAEYAATGEKQDDRVDISHTHEYEELAIDRTKEHTRAFIKVQDGCNQFCTYCIIPFARGRVRSRKPEEVVEEVRRLAASGCREVVITGIHLCTYGQDLDSGTDLAALLEKVSRTEEIRRIRLGSLEPRYLSEEVIKRMSKIEKLCPHFHLSLQSGCDRTLKRMNRGYTSAEFMEICRNLRKYFEDPALTADVIVGFPGETEEDFRETESFLRQVSFFETHIFPYSRRQGTKAASYPDQITEKVKRERSAVLRSLHEKNREKYLQRYVGIPSEVLLEETVEAGGRKYWMGHTTRYQKVLIPECGQQSNTFVRVVPERVDYGDCLVCGETASMQ